MTYSKCGLLLLLAAGGLAACGGDPTDAFREEGMKILADPASVFVDQGAQKFVVIELVDDQGNQLETDFDPTDVTPGITVVRDSSFLPTTNGGTLKTRERLIVTGVTPSSGSFKIGPGDAALTIPVKVIPTSLVATFSTQTPAMNEPVTMSAEGYHFPEGTTVVVGDTAIVLGISEDGTSITFVPVPGATGPATVGGLTIDFLPETPLDLTTTEELTVGPLVALAGTDAPGTAPALEAPAAGTTTGLFDAVPLGATACGEANDGVPCQLYSISLPADVTLHARLDVSNLTDLGLYVLSADGTTDIEDQACDAFGNAGDSDNPGVEECDLELPAGDYLLAVVSYAIFYGPDPEPDWIGLSLTPVVAEPEP
jgi:hypothetical protein